MARTRKTKSTSGTGSSAKTGAGSGKATETPEDTVATGGEDSLAPETTGSGETAPADALGIGDDITESGATETPGDETVPAEEGRATPLDTEDTTSAALSSDADDTVTVENSNTLEAGRDLTPEGHPSDAHIGEDADTAAVADEPLAFATGSGEGGASGTTPPPRDDDTVLPGNDTMSGDDSPASSDEPLAFAIDSGEGDAQGTAPPRSDDTHASSAAPSKEVVERTVVERKGGFVPMLLGGVAAAALGFFAAMAMPGLVSQPPDPAVGEMQSRLDSQSGDIEGLTSRSDTFATDIEDIRTALGGIDTAALQTALTDLTAQVSQIDERLTALERRPVEESVSPEAMAAYEREFEQLRQSVSQQQQELNAALEEERNRIAAMADEARTSETNAAAQAQLAESRTILAELTTRLREGEAYAEQLGALRENDVTVPEPLAAPAADGVAALGALQDDFPPLARDALRQVRAEQGNTGVGDAIQNLFNARSVTPREGDDADAVLSRAEAALDSGNLDTALTELEALPASAAEVMSGWVSRAQTRRDALDAASALADELNQ